LIHDKRTVEMCVVAVVHHPDISDSWFAQQMAAVHIVARQALLEMIDSIAGFSPPQVPGLQPS
jgi:hypothetical protein